jgi:hypothetical protein
MPGKSSHVTEARWVKGYSSNCKTANSMLQMQVHYAIHKKGRSLSSPQDSGHLLTTDPGNCSNCSKAGAKNNHAQSGGCSNGGIGPSPLWPSGHWQDPLCEDGGQCRKLVAPPPPRGYSTPQQTRQGHVTRVNGGALGMRPRKRFLWHWNSTAGYHQRGNHHPSIPPPAISSSLARKGGGLDSELT